MRREWYLSLLHKHHLCVYLPEIIRVSATCVVRWCSFTTLMHMAIKQVEVMPYEAIASLLKAGEQWGQGTSSAKGWELGCSTGGAAEAVSVSSGN